MALKLELLEDICATTSAQVKDLYPDMELMFIVHDSGQFQDVVKTREYAVSLHPAGDIARTILERNSHRELSGFIGLAMQSKATWLGLGRKENILALFNINMGEFENLREARRMIYHLAWHAIDLYDVRQRREYAAKFRTGPLIPKRSPMNLARLNLQADIFAFIMCGLMGEEKSLHDTAMLRARNSLLPLYSSRAEDYPFMIGYETADYAYNEVSSSQPPKGKFVSFARQAALEVSQAFDDGNIRQWWGFSEPAQDMAWRNFTPETILACAINTSPDPFVRAIGHLIADFSRVAPATNTEVIKIYNSFMPQEQNKLLHREIMEQTFQDAISRGIEMESGQPLLVAANMQNESLLEGRILGWCANALQASARAFENALASGVSPAQAATLEFESTKEDASWDSIKKLGEEIIEKKRQGVAMTMNTMADFCAGNNKFAVIAGAVKATISYAPAGPALTAANDFTPAFASPAPSSPAPKGPAPVQPGFTAAPSGPALGGGGNQAFRQQVMAERQRLLREQGSKDDTSQQ
jgi:hypothetical protein